MSPRSCKAASLESQVASAQIPRILLTDPSLFVDFSLESQVRELLCYAL